MSLWQILLIVLLFSIGYIIYISTAGKKRNKKIARITINADYSMNTELISPNNKVLEKRSNGSYSESAIRHLSDMYENQGYKVEVDSHIQRDETEKEFSEKESEEVHNKEKAIKKFKEVGLTFEESDYLAQDIAELSLFTDSKLFAGEEANVHSIEEAYKDKNYMATVDHLIGNNLPIKAIAYTGIQARAMGLNFEVRTAMKKSVFDYLEREELDNTHFKESFMQTLNTVQVREGTEDVSPVLNLLYEKGYLLTKDTNKYDEYINMIQKGGVAQFLKNFQTLLQEGSEWYGQVDNPESQLQKITSLSLSWMGGKLEDIRNDISNEDLLPLDIFINVSKYQEEIYDALSEAENSGNFPEMNDSYRNDVAGRYLQYMLEKKRLIVLTNREVQIEVSAIQHIIDRLNKSKLDYDDIENVYHNPKIGDTVLTLEMNNEENFSLVFDNIEDMQIAQDIISFATYSDLSKEKETYFFRIGIPKLLIDSTKMLFDDFIDQYDLDSEELDAVYNWEENNDEENRKNKIVDFSNYSLEITREASSLVVAVLRKTEDEVTDSNNKLLKNEKLNAQPQESDDRLGAISEMKNHINLLSIEEKTIEMMSKVSRNFSDETNLDNLIEMGYGKEEDLRTWFNLDMPGKKETGGSYIIGRFLQMLLIHNMMYQDFGNHVITDEVFMIIDNKNISERMDELAELNSAHSLASSFEDWQGQFLMELKEHDIEYEDINESYITRYLVLETMFRAMILRMN